MENKALIMRECDRANAARRVCTGRVDYQSFFCSIRGDLLISGRGADDRTMITDLIYGELSKGDLPTIVLSSHTDLFQALQEWQAAGTAGRVMISCPGVRSYHPMYGMSPQQVLRFVRLAGEELGYGVMMDQVLLYAAAVLNIVSTKYPVSLPAMAALLKEDDDFISTLPEQRGLTNVIADNIRGSHEAGIVLRRICERLEEVFEEVYSSGNDTGYSIQCHAQRKVAFMAYYHISCNQALMNCYLKEELFSTLRHVPKVRLILDEAVFVDEADELLHYIFQMKRQGKIELIVVSKNAKDSMFGMAVDFKNICLFQHDNFMVTEAISRELFGTYLYHYPVPVAGRPPAVMFTFKKAVHWQIATEERPRVRVEDMYGKQHLYGSTAEYLAVKTMANDNVYLIPSDTFRDKHKGRYLISEEQEVM